LNRFVPRNSKSLINLAIRFSGSDPLRNQGDLIDRQLLDPDVAEELFTFDK